MRATTAPVCNAVTEAGRGAVLARHGGGVLCLPPAPSRCVSAARREPANQGEHGKTGDRVRRRLR
jgi:hypothetical protein